MSGREIAANESRTKQEGLPLHILPFFTWRSEGGPDRRGKGKEGERIKKKDFLFSLVLLTVSILIVGREEKAVSLPIFFLIRYTDDAGAISRGREEKKKRKRETENFSPFLCTLEGVGVKERGKRERGEGRIPKSQPLLFKLSYD